MATFELWDKGFKFLKERFLAYPPYTKTGECTENYVVFRDDTTGPKSNYSSEVHYYSVICYSKSYSSSFPGIIQSITINRIKLNRDKAENKHIPKIVKSSLTE